LAGVIVDWVSDVHYWTIERTNEAGTVVPKTDLSGNQTVTLHYGTNDQVTDGISLTVCKNTYTALNQWIDVGGNGAEWNGEIVEFLDLRHRQRESAQDLRELLPLHQAAWQAKFAALEAERKLHQVSLVLELATEIQ